MEYTRLGNTGTQVSRIALGCMSFGDSTRGSTGNGWALNPEDSKAIIRHAIELGINFFDTANTYSAGTSEEYTGKALRELLPRDEYVISTKVYYPVDTEGVNHKGLSRKNILSEIDRSLQRLGLDYVDLYQIHRWDYNTPIEETMEALNDVIKSGKARYIGASSMYAWQFSKAQHIAEQHGWAKFVTMQNLYNLIYREEEREMVPLCIDQNVGMIPWSPLAKGRLAKVPGVPHSKRFEAETIGNTFFPMSAESDRTIITRVQEIAEKHGCQMSQVALAWHLSKPYVTAPIIGATKPDYLDAAVGALNLTLTADEISYLEQPYTPHEVVAIH